MKSKKTFYKPVVTLRDSEKEWEVVIYSRYESEEEAREGLARFCNIPSNVYEIVDTRIEKWR